MSSPTVAAPETVVKAEIPEPAAPAADMASTKPKKAFASIRHAALDQIRQRTKSKHNQSLDDATLETEFLNFMARIRKMDMGHSLAYQVNNFKQINLERRWDFIPPMRVGVECTFRVSRDDSYPEFTSSFKTQGSKVQKNVEVKIKI
ncbi:uncharacterized protein LOC111705600 isoform X1 [Eurytemora carolleeae]|uniref:uncharacterized protein LOC111705600 isoform X1 n=1 Tax=Eurytemora carolleeae TaxID=1294199 RepID=UPI000C75837E|nr:uncharacterized protein LOC111705600 isoform X1 [Eurytemora carolleeae]|eukprot:XP_023333961.1 uncharacterized protein LOC111705600 isoform X1 [Eurytemora affinis]